MPTKRSSKKKTEETPEIVVRAKREAPAVDDLLLDQIAAAIQEAGVSGAAAMEGARLTQHWIEEAGEFDRQFPTIAAEIAWFLILEKYTVAVGMMDRVAMDGEGLFGSEWKTTKGTTRFWNEEKWLEQIKNGPQISIYGLAMHEGMFVVPEYFESSVQGETVVGGLGEPRLWMPKVKTPRMLVRAITKENPPNLWGVDPPAFFEIDNKRLKVVREALTLKGDQIRVAKARKSVPWQLTGIQCQDRFHFGEMCRFYDECSRGVYPEAELKPFNTDDPGSRALMAAQSLMRVPLSDPRVVVLSASAYGDVTDCLEKHRRVVIQGSEENPELDKGTAFHAGVAEYYKKKRSS